MHSRLTRRRYQDTASMEEDSVSYTTSFFPAGFKPSISRLWSIVGLTVDEETVEKGNDEEAEEDEAVHLPGSFTPSTSSHEEAQDASLNTLIIDALALVSDPEAEQETCSDGLVVSTEPDSFLEERTPPLAPAHNATRPTPDSIHNPVCPGAVEDFEHAQAQKRRAPLWLHRKLPTFAPREDTSIHTCSDRLVLSTEPGSFLEEERTPLPAPASNATRPTPDSTRNPVCLGAVEDFEYAQAQKRTAPLWLHRKLPTFTSREDTSCSNGLVLTTEPGSFLEEKRTPLPIPASYAARPTTDCVRNPVLLGAVKDLEHARAQKRTAPLWLHRKLPTVTPREDASIHQRHRSPSIWLYRKPRSSRYGVARVAAPRLSPLAQKYGIRHRGLP